MESLEKNFATLEPAPAPSGFEHAYANANGITIHYVIGGKGEPLVLLHGYGQNWYMWERLMPALSEHFTVIAPDLRGIGETDKPATGYDKKTMAADIHELVKGLGYQQANLAGHDIGLMVAYSYAAQYPLEVKKLALMDAVLPGIEPAWNLVKAQAWWFGFLSQPHAGEILSDKIGLFIADFWAMASYQKDAFTQAEKQEFIRAYAIPGTATSSAQWYTAFTQDAEDNIAFSKTPLAMPVLAMGSDHTTGVFLAAHCRLVATHVQEIIIRDSGHWVVQEQTAQVQQTLIDFFV